MHLQGTKHFLQGEAPCHKAKKVNQSLPKGPTSSSSRCHANFPDLNPIANALAWMNFKLRETSCFNIPEWKGEIIKLWVTSKSNSYSTT
jgi:hypothetical protein